MTNLHNQPVASPPRFSGRALPDPRICVNRYRVDFVNSVLPPFEHFYGSPSAIQAYVNWMYPKSRFGSILHVGYLPLRVARTQPEGGIIW